MKPTAEQLQVAAKIDAKVKRLLEEDKTDLDIFLEMADDMPDFKRLLGSGHDLMDALCLRFEGFYPYAKILEEIAKGIASGEIQVPK